MRVTLRSRRLSDRCRLGELRLKHTARRGQRIAVYVRAIAALLDERRERFKIHIPRGTGGERASADSRERTLEAANSESERQLDVR
jgi:hypothetical protein